MSHHLNDHCISSPVVTIGFVETEYTTEEGTTVEVCVNLTSGELEMEVTVTLTSRGASATGKDV